MPPGSNRPHRKKVKHYDNGEPHFLTFSCYVHRNLVRRGLVERAEDWPWSSARDWVRMDHSVPSVDRTLPETLDIPWVDRRMERRG